MPFNNIINLGGKFTNADLETRHVLFLEKGEHLSYRAVQSIGPLIPSLFVNGRSRSTT